MTVRDVLCNFRSALIALLPYVERVEVPWRRPDAYDDWDSLVSALYDTLVVEVLRGGIPKSLREGFALPPYDLLLKDYSTLSLIEVVSAVRDDQIIVFHSLGTEQEPFDTVEARIVSAEGVPLSEELDTRPFKTAHFRLRARDKDGKLLPFDMVALGERLIG